MSDTNPELTAAIEWFLSIKDTPKEPYALALLKLARPSRTMPEAMILVHQLFRPRQ